MNGIFKNCLTIPNLLSVIRILLIPVFVVLFVKGYPLWALLVLGISGLTDLFDGKIARKFNQISELGKLLDPIADKITQIAVVIVLFIKFSQADSPALKAFSWVFILFIAKELLMLGFGSFMLSIGLKPTAAEIYGKVSTFFFYGAMILILAFGPEVGALSSIYLNMTMPDWLVMTLVIISLVLTFVALGSYIPGVWKQLKERKKQQGDNK